MSNFRDLVEAKETIVFAFGRFNPPTTGHEKLIQKTASVAGSNPYRIYPSFTQNPKKDPLPHSVKTAYMRKMFKKYAKKIIADTAAKTAIMIAEKLYKEGYKNLIMVAGSDRVKEFSTLLNRYNDAPDQKGNQLFKFDSVKVVSAGERDPDSEGVEGMSASKMRAAATGGDFDSFSQGVPSGFADGKKLYMDVRKYMGIREDRYMGDMTDFETLRDLYLTGKIWNVGDIVEANGLTGEVVRKGTNYLSFMTEDGKVHKAWLHDINEGVKDLPPHLQKLVKQLDKKEKELEKKGLKVKTFIYNPDTGKPDIELGEEVELDEVWWDKAIAKLNQVSHPKEYGKMVKQYAELMRQEKYKKRPNMAADQVAREYSGVSVREFIKYINTLVAKKVLPQELKAEYEGEDNMFTFKEFVDKIQEDKNAWKKVSTELMGGPEYPLKSIDTHAKEAGINPPLLHHTLRHETGKKHFQSKDAVKKGRGGKKIKVEKGDVVLGDTDQKHPATGIGQIRQPALTDMNDKYKTKTTVKDLQDREVNIASAAKILKMYRKDTGNPKKDDRDARINYVAGPNWRGTKLGPPAAAKVTKQWDKDFGKVKDVDQKPKPPIPKKKLVTPAEKEKRLFPAGRGGRIGDQPSAADIVKAQKPTKAEKPFKDVPTPRPKPPPPMNPPIPGRKPPLPKKEEFDVNEDQVSDTGVRTKKLKSGNIAKTDATGTTISSPKGQQLSKSTPRIGGLKIISKPHSAAGPGPRGVKKTKDYKGKLGGTNVHVTRSDDEKGTHRTAAASMGGITTRAKSGPGGWKQSVKLRGVGEVGQSKKKGEPVKTSHSFAKHDRKEEMTFKDFVNQIQERELTPTELKRREEIAKDLPDADFKQRYGDRWKEVKMGTATKMAKNES